MRSMLDEAKLQRFLAAVGRRATTPGRVYLTGGSTALLLGIRAQTVDIDIKLDPEPGGIFEAIAELKESLGVNVELASPDLFVPALPGWRERSEFIARFGKVDFHHYDFYGQALSKLSRGHKKDLADVAALRDQQKVQAEKLLDLFEEVRSQLIRYPALNVPDLERRLRAFVQESK